MHHVVIHERRITLLYVSMCSTFLMLKHGIFYKNAIYNSVMESFSAFAQRTMKDYFWPIL